METQEQRVEMDEITTRANNFAISQMIEPTTNARFGLMSNNTTPTSGLSNVPSWTLDQLVGQMHQLSFSRLDQISGQLNFFFDFTYDNIVTRFSKVLSPLFRFIKADITIVFEFKSSPQVAGMYAIYFDNTPARLRDYIGYQNDPVVYTMRLPRTLVTLGTNQVKKFEMKWDSNLNKLSGTYGSNLNVASTGYDMGQVGLRCINTPRYVTGVSTPTVRVWGMLTNVSYSGYVPGNNFT